MNNAIKYTETGSVTVRIKSDRSTFTFEVEDTGPGLTEEEQVNLFQEYGRIHRTKGVKGTGLGLALVKKLIAACEGSVAVHSEEKDKGNTFSFTLPTRPQPKELLFGPIAQSLGLVNPEQVQGITVDHRSAFLLLLVTPSLGRVN